MDCGVECGSRHLVFEVFKRSFLFTLFAFLYLQSNEYLQSNFYIFNQISLSKENEMGFNNSHFLILSAYLPYVLDQIPSFSLRFLTVEHNMSHCFFLPSSFTSTVLLPILIVLCLVLCQNLLSLLFLPAYLISPPFLRLCKPIALPFFPIHCFYLSSRLCLLMLLISLS